MEYQSLLQKLYSIKPTSTQQSLDRIEKLMNALDNPQQQLRFVHITGTNGKGTVATVSADILQRSGRKVGLFTSPYIYEFTDRISINTTPIPKQMLIKYAEIVLPIAMDLGCSMFEVVFGIAMLHFCSEQCDVVCLEVGIGGKFDCTNVVQNTDIAVICNIDLEHTQVLGDTIEQIATNKSGIIKKGCRTIIYPKMNPKAEQVIATVAEEMQSTLICPSDLIMLETPTTDLADRSTVEFEYDGAMYSTNILGEHQLYNLLLAIEVGRYYSVQSSVLQSSLSNVQVRGRFEKIAQNPTIYYDVAHNPQAMQGLAHTISTLDKKVVLLLAMSKDKQCENTVQVIAEQVDTIVIVPLEQRSEDVQKIKNTAKLYCEEVTVHSSIKEGLEYAKQIIGTSDDSVVVATGSCYLGESLYRLM